jgi:hypothetical protein
MVYELNEKSTIPAEDGNRYSLLDRLRRAPTRISAAGMLSGGRPRTTDLRAVLNAIFYLLRTGCQLSICT